MNLTQSDIAKRNLKGDETIEASEYRLIELPRGIKAKCIYSRKKGERKMKPTNMLEVNGSDVWADTLLTKFSANDLNKAEQQAYFLAQQ